MIRWLTGAAYAVLAAGVVATSINVYGLLEGLRDDTRAIEASRRDLMVWTASQFRHELYQLTTALTGYSRGLERGAADAARLRFDVFWSRLENAGQGPLGRRYMELPGAEDAVGRGRVLLARLEPMFESLGAARGEQLLEAEQSLRALLPAFSSIALESLGVSQADKANRAQRLEQRTFRIEALLLGLLLLFGGVGALIAFGRWRDKALSATLLRRFDAATESLRESEQRYRLLVENAPEAIVVLDVESGRFVDANQNAARLLRLPVGELLRLGPLDVSPPEQPDGRPSAELAAHYVEEAVNGGNPTFDWVHRAADGTEVPCEIRLIRMPAGFAVHVRGSVVDVTERRKTERELARYREHLESIVAERTEELMAAQHELLRTERLAAIGQLIGTVSHELRNPLGAISASFATVKATIDTDDPRVQRALARIDRGIKRCVRIIEELLDYARFRELSPENIRLADWLPQLLAELEVPEGVAFEQHIEPDAVAHADPERLRQVLVNLVQNAFQTFAEHGHAVPPPGAAPRVVVSAECAEDGVCLCVADNGPGIPDEAKGHIFEPLFSTRSFGVGLGLPLVRRIVEQHGGTMSLSSEPGEGAIFRIHLPVE